MTFVLNSNVKRTNLNGTDVDQLFASEDATGEVLWPLTDHQGTVREVVEMSGSTDVPEIVETITYGAFGNIVSVEDETGASVAEPTLSATYTGREWDADAQLFFYRARWYDADTGRFVSEDPMGFAAGDANLSRYVGNGSYNSTDPSGLFDEPLSVGFPSRAVMLTGQSPRPANERSTIGRTVTLEETHEFTRQASLRPQLSTYSKAVVRVHRALGSIGLGPVKPIGWLPGPDSQLEELLRGGSKGVQAYLQRKEDLNALNPAALFVLEEEAQRKAAEPAFRAMTQKQRDQIREQDDIDAILADAKITGNPMAQHIIEYKYGSKGFAMFGSGGFMEHAAIALGGGYAGVRHFSGEYLPQPPQIGSSVLYGENYETLQTRLGRRFVLLKEELIYEYLKEKAGVEAWPNPYEGVDGKGRQGDAFIHGVKHEFKTLDEGSTARTIRNRVNESKKRGGQAREMIFDVRGTGLSEADAIHGSYLGIGAGRGKVDGITVIGDNYFFRTQRRDK